MLTIMALVSLFFRTFRCPQQLQEQTWVTLLCCILISSWLPWRHSKLITMTSFQVYYHDVILGLLSKRYSNSMIVLSLAQYWQNTSYRKNIRKYPYFTITANKSSTHVGESSGSRCEQVFSTNWINMYRITPQSAPWYDLTDHAQCPAWRSTITLCFTFARGEKARSNWYGRTGRWWPWLYTRAIWKFRRGQNLDEL